MHRLLLGDARHASTTRCVGTPRAHFAAVLDPEWHVQAALRANWAGFQTTTSVSVSSTMSGAHVTGRLCPARQLSCVVGDAVFVAAQERRPSRRWFACVARFRTCTGHSEMGNLSPIIWHKIVNRGARSWSTGNRGLPGPAVPRSNFGRDQERWVEFILLQRKPGRIGVTEQRRRSNAQPGGRCELRDAVPTGLDRHQRQRGPETIPRPFRSPSPTASSGCSALIRERLERDPGFTGRRCSKKVCSCLLAGRGQHVGKSKF